MFKKIKEFIAYVKVKKEFKEQISTFITETLPIINKVVDKNKDIIEVVLNITKALEGKSPEEITAIFEDTYEDAIKYYIDTLKEKSETDIKDGE